MAVKEGLPATDFSRMNREYIRNVAEGETVKDGLPATDFSRMNREYIKAVVEEAGGGGGKYTTATMTITAKGAYAGKTFAIPNLFTDEGTDILNPSVNIDVGTYTVLLLNGAGSAYFDPNLVENPWDITVTGDAEYADGYLDYTGDFSIAFGQHS